jgi:hypothetical protein
MRVKEGNGSLHRPIRNGWAKGGPDVPTLRVVGQKMDFVSWEYAPAVVMANPVQIIP